MSRFLPIVAALLTVGAMVAVSQAGIERADRAPESSSSGPPSDPYAGIPQRGIALGRKDAPLTMVEFADLQCPFCRDYAVDVLPQIVERYVRTGELRLELRTLQFLGPDSVTAASGAGAAAAQNRLWQYADLFYGRQGMENSGYVTHGFLHGIAADAGLDVNRFARQMESPEAGALAERAEADAELLGVQATPSFFVGRTGSALAPLAATELEFGQFAAAIEGAR